MRNVTPEPGPENTVQYGPYSEQEYFKILEKRRELNINNLYNEANTKKFKKIVIEEEKIDYSKLNNQVNLRPGSPEGNIIRIDEEDDTSFMELERINEMKDREKNGILAKSRNKLIYLFKEEVYKTSYERCKAKGRLKDIENTDFSELLFFQDDRLNLALRYIAQENKQYYRHKYSLSMWYYLESLVLHFFQIGLLGPFIYVISFFHWPYFTFFNNMNFFNLKSSNFYISLLFWISFLLAIIGHFWLDYSSLDYGFIAMMLTMTIARSSIIAAKYATFTPQYRERCMSRKICDGEKQSWQIVNYWAKCDPIFIEEQIELSIRRKFIDKATFKISFFDFCSDEAHWELKTPKNGHSYQRLSVSEGHTEFMTFSGVNIYYDCKSVFYNFIRTHYLERQNIFIMPAFIILSIFWVLFPVFGRMETDLTYFGDNLTEKIFFISGMVTCFFFFMIVILFFRQAYMDYDRIRFILRQMSQMISPVKLPGIRQKMYPTINLVDVVSLQAWANLRKILFDYGINFQTRHKIYMPMCFGIATVSGLLVIFSERILKGRSKDEIFRFQCPLAISYIVFGLKFLVITRICQLMNKNAESQIKILRNVQQIFKSFAHFKDFYIGKNPNGMKRKSKRRKMRHFDALPYDCNEIFEHETASREHQWINFRLRMLMGNNYLMSNEYLKKLCEVTEEIIKGIEFQSEWNYATVLGLKANHALLGACIIWYVVLGSYGWLASFYLRFD